MRNRMNRRVAIGLMSFAGLSTAMGDYSLAQDINQRPVETKKRSQYPLVLHFQSDAQSSYEAFSPLTNSPRDIRGPFDWVTSHHGVPISEAFPKYAAIAERTSLIRSVDCENTNHNAYKVLTPDISEQAKRLDGGLMPYVITQVDPKLGFGRWPELIPGKALVSDYNPKRKKYKSPKFGDAEPTKRRRELLASLESKLIEDARVLDFVRNRELAFDLLIGGRNIKKLFDVTKDQKERYGNNPLGIASAVATNLALAGAGVVVIYNNHQHKNGYTGWDLHKGIEKGTKEMAPRADQALTASIEDAERYGFVVASTTDHGRTPKINKEGGRDHSPIGYLVGAGGNFRKGAVFGDLGRDGMIKSDKVTSGRVFPTLLAACGVPLKPEEQPVKEVLV